MQQGKKKKHDGGDKDPPKVLVARLAVPGYMASRRMEIESSPPGHKFLLWFKGVTCRVTKKGKKQQAEEWARNQEWDTVPKNDVVHEWEPLSERKRTALKAVTARSSIAESMLGAIEARRRAAKESLGEQTVFSASYHLVAPLATGLGNPHPVENGFTFMNPYGVPCLPGSAVKGVVRRAAEELALFDEESRWTVPLVWLLFGFEEKSAYVDQVDKKASEIARAASERWKGCFKQWAEEHVGSDTHLNAFLRLVGSQLKEKYRKMAAKNPREFIESLQESKSLRRSIHWKGLLRFWDAFPAGKFEMGVDIMNPHHKGYFEGQNPPHDSESPLPVFFLVLEPGCKFEFLVQLDRTDPSVDNWKELLGQAFDYAADNLGFGAKTAVGYGAMSVEAQVQVAAGAAAGDRTRVKADLAEKTETWKEALLSLNPGSGEITAKYKGKTSAPIRGQEAKELILALGNRAKKLRKTKHLVNVALKVRKRGNKIEILGLAEGE